MTVRTASLLLVCLLLATSAQAAQPYAGALTQKREVRACPPEKSGALEARSALLMDLASGELLYAQNPDMAVPPASLTKIMSLYVLFDAIDHGETTLLDTVLVSPVADRTGGSSMGAVTGHEYPLWEILKGIAVASGNDAAQAAAETFPGGYDVFIQRMNDTAANLGMNDTHFENPHGLPAEGQVTTSHDMLLLARDYLKRFPQALRLHSMPFSWQGRTKLRNRNRLLRNCQGVDGLKTGYVRASGYNIVITAERQGRRLVGVLLGAKSPGARAREAGKLLEMGFSVREKDAGHTAARANTPPDISDQSATALRNEEAL